jgi:predicted TIM-barrel fold metal-dependent hydrolase
LSTAAIQYPIIDSDSHLSEDPDLWLERMPKKWGDSVPKVTDDAAGLPRWRVGDQFVTPVAQYAVAGWKEFPPSYPPTIEDADRAAFDAQLRLDRMDEYGISAQIIYPNLLSFSTTAFLKIGPDFATDCVRAYNDWVSEWAALDPARLLPMMVLPFWDVQESVREMERCAAMGFKGIVFSNSFDAVGLPAVTNEHWDPLYSTAQDLGLPINFHVGFAALSEDDLAVRLEQSAKEHVRVTSVGLMSNARAISDVISTGLCHRFPKLNFVSVESGAGWMPYLLESLDWHWVNFGAGHENPEMELPSFYFRRQIYGTFWFEEAAVKSALEVLPDNIMFETDFPHMTSLSPGPASAAEVPSVMVAKALAGQPDDVARKVLFENAAKLYGLELPTIPGS